MENIVAQSPSIPNKWRWLRTNRGGLRTGHQGRTYRERRRRRRRQRQPAPEVSPMLEPRTSPFRGSCRIIAPGAVVSSCDGGIWHVPAPPYPRSATPMRSLTSRHPMWMSTCFGRIGLCGTPSQQMACVATRRHYRRSAGSGVLALMAEAARLATENRPKLKAFDDKAASAATLSSSIPPITSS